MRLKDKVAIVTGAAGFGSFLFCRSVQPSAQLIACFPTGPLA
jgi:hypothetical protein